MKPVDYEEMRQVASLCMHLVDAKEWERLGEVFMEDAIYDGRQTITGKVAHGVSEIVELWSGLRMGVHSSTDFVITRYSPDDDAAESVSKWASKQFDGRLNTGRYVDVWKRTRKGWRIAHRINIVMQPDGE